MRTYLTCVYYNDYNCHTTLITKFIKHIFYTLKEYAYYN